MATVPVTRKELQDEMKKLTDTIDRWRAPFQAKLEKHDKSLFGNGEPGLDEITRNLKTTTDTQTKTIEEMKAFIEVLKPMVVFYKVGVWLAGVIGVSVVALIWGMITDTIQIIKP